MLYNEATVDGDAEHQCSPPHWPPKKKKKKAEVAAREAGGWTDQEQDWRCTGEICR